MKLREVNKNLDKITISDIESHKLITDDELNKDLQKLREKPADENANCFYGNKFQYHFQLKNLMKCKRERGKTLYEYWEDKELWNKLIDQTIKKNRPGASGEANIFECHRVNTGSIVLFKAFTAKYIFKKYGATKVLDPTAGWGGRMLGAWSLDIDYTGIDTNTNMKPAYDGMIEHLNNFHDGWTFTEPSNLNMIWDNSLNVDFSKLDYDFVFTSPPYVNMELYENMTPWKTNEDFYKDFFIPLWEKCLRDIKKGGKVCFNISPKMYDDAISFGLKPCDIEEDLLQQLGQQHGKKKQDKIYIWES